MENLPNSPPSSSLKRAREESEELNTDSDTDSDEIWEKVSSVESNIADNLEISIPTSSLNKSSKHAKKKGKGFTKQDRLDREMLHKSHLVCLLAAGYARNRWCNEELLQAHGLSCIQHSEKLSPNSRLFTHQLKTLVSNWMSERKGTGSLVDNRAPSEFQAQTQLSSNSINLCFTSACRALSLTTRLVCSLHPIPLSLAALDFLGDFDPIQIWCEVYSPYDGEWIPVHAYKGLVQEPFRFVTTTKYGPSQTSYVLAFDETFGIKDVTKKYTAQWGASTAKLRLKRGGQAWWYETLLKFAKSWHDKKEKSEDVQLEHSEMNERMPTSLSGFLNHPLYVLERHVKKSEMIYPSGQDVSIGVFKNELVYPRALVHKLLTKEGWLKQGKSIKDNEAPCKTVKKARSEKRDPCSSSELPESGPTESLFGEWQTQDCIPPELINGQIPKNSYGNIEIFHANMVPKETLHIEEPGCAQIAKNLGLDYAPALTGFDFVKGQAVPRLQGIIIKQEDAELVISACIQVSQLSREKEAQRKSKKAIHLWGRLTAGLIHLNKLREQYLHQKE